VLVLISNEDLNFQKEEKTPLIEGGQGKYKVGSMMDLNCSTTSPAVLKWFIKNQEVGLYEHTH